MDANCPRPCPPTPSTMRYSSRITFSKRSIAVGLLIVAAVCILVYLNQTRRWNSVRIVAPDENKSKNDAQFHLSRLNVTPFNKCDAVYNELRDVSFDHPSMKQRICDGVAIYTLFGAHFPPCVLNNQLPQQIYDLVRKSARVATVQRALHDTQMPLYTFNEQDAMSRQLLRTHTWETIEVRRVLGILKRFPTNSVTFLDVGSDMGVYGLQAREEGFPVVVVDANFRTLIRLQMTARNMGLLHEKLTLIWSFLDEKVALKLLNWVSVGNDCHVSVASSNAVEAAPDNSPTDTIPVMTARAEDLGKYIKTKKVVIKMDLGSGFMFMRTGARLFAEFDIAVLVMKFGRTSGQAAHMSPFYNDITSFMTARGFLLHSFNTQMRVNPAAFDESHAMWVRNDYIGLVFDRSFN